MVSRIQKKICSEKQTHQIQNVALRQNHTHREQIL